jgi:hypothetical protein
VKIKQVIYPGIKIQAWQKSHTFSKQNDSGESCKQNNEGAHNDIIFIYNNYETHCLFG